MAYRVSARQALFTVAVAGNPNSGKTTLFNALTGASARTGNHPGITVEQRDGILDLPRSGRVRLVDIPGNYSLNARSPEEEVAINSLLGRRGQPRPDAVLVVLDASALERNLYLLMQVMEFDLPVIAVVNMLDSARDDGMDISFDSLRQTFGIPFVGTIARRRQGVDLLRRELDDFLGSLPKRTNPDWLWTPHPSLNREVEGLAPLVGEEVSFDLPSKQSRRAFSFWLLSCLHRESDLVVKPRLREAALAARARLKEEGLDLDVETIVPRWNFIDKAAERIVRREKPRSQRTERIDGVLTHPLWGSLFFIGIMSVVFQALFSWSGPLISGIESAFGWLSGAVAGAMPPSLGRDLIIDGIISGVGGVLVFLPQILILFLFIAILEGSGYMSRSAFMVDRLMRRIGLHGNAFVPLISGFACAVPAIMATRTIENRRDRMLTMMVLPLISCSARLPVYSMIIALIFPGDVQFGPFRAGTLVLLSVYILSTVLALVAAGLLGRTVLKGKPQPLLLELPPYRLPEPRTVLLALRDRAKAFLATAGTIILVATVLLWVLLAFPRNEPPVGATPAAAAAAQIEGSYAGRLGTTFEPLIAPLGFDWKIGVGLIGSFAAREVFVSTMGVVYGVGDVEEIGDRDLREAMRRDTRRDGSPLWTPLTGLSLMAFFMVAMQCMSTLAVTRRETNSWGWTAFMLTYLTTVAWLMSFAVYQLGRLAGYA